MLNIAVAFLVLILAALPAGAAETIQVTTDMAVRIDFSSDRWVLSEEAPEFLLEETAEHLEHELEAQGKEATREQVLQVAVRRLKANEAFLYNPRTEAVLTIDFSPLREDERAPGGRSVATSARYAVESLEQEEGVSGFDSSVEPADLAGVRYAQRIDAAYRHHEEPRNFVGIVAFEPPNWIFLYYTDPLRDPADKEAMNRILGTLTVVPAGAD